MSIVNTKRFGVWLATFLTIGIASSAWARPNMWWDHFESTTPDQSQCVKQAEAIMTKENAGHLSTDSDSVRAWTDKTIAVAECIAFGDKLIVAILVSSEDPEIGSPLYNALRTGMKK